MSLADRKFLKTFSLINERHSRVTIEWARDSKSFYYVTTDGSRNSLWQQILDDENPHLVGDLGDEEIASLAMSPDGTSFAFIRGRWIHDAVLIEGLK
jgi:Tol biopolymer transport system component